VLELRLERPLYVHLRVELVRQDEVQERPELGKTVLKGRAGQQKPPASAVYAAEHVE
jgi:hypothetical protein